MKKIKKDFLEQPSIRPKFITARRGSVDVGKLVGIVIFLIVIGLFGYAIWWVTKSVGDAGSQYGSAMVDTRRKAAALQCQMNMRAVWQNMRMYSIEKENFPPSLEALAEWGADPRQFRCEASDDQQYVYIPGQNENMPGENVLIYELKGVHEGRCNLLRVNGQMELLTPEKVQDAVTKTHLQLRGRR
ncbi:MAG: hypothetical protein ACYS32_04475 [Planctomycetota bacterium]|jgi:hypothetical protein